ncbi:Dullard phosphatase domain, eukaryotic [Artemisia annua]|uniref:Dullard phosphatase domain, eukaryotic n=1 Tax=Artemisia annua TaxID=35608 RepID=A0A2U1LHU4_ARTAN|nr:Dullard phosphatase domain, eukaryotic [Artemisia annua]
MKTHPLVNHNQINPIIASKILKPTKPRIILKVKQLSQTPAARRVLLRIKPPSLPQPALTTSVKSCQDSSTLLPQNKTLILLDDDDTLNHSVCYPTFAIPPFISSDFQCEYDIRNHLLPPPNCDSAGYFSTLLPPNSLNQKTVVLDMDETLIHSTLFRDTSMAIKPPKNYDFLVTFGQEVAYVTKRPFVDEFLQYLNQKNFEVVIFTASSKEYASPVLDRLDPNGFILHRLYRNSRKLVDGKHVKDLSNLGRDLKNVVIVDDRPRSYMLQPENGIPIKRFIDDLQDAELKKLMDSFFRSCDQYEDIRDAVKHYQGLSLKLRLKYRCNMLNVGV